MKKLVFFDVEWANSKNKSICQLGLITIDFETRDKLYLDVNTLINPNDEFDSQCVLVHHITKESVKNSETFDIVWKNVQERFTKAIIVGHNVKSADLDALVKNLRRYNLDIPEMYFLDTYEVAKNVIFPSLVADYGLNSLCKFFSIDFTKTHNAFEDAKACYELFYHLVDNFKVDIDKYIQRYIPNDTKEFSVYLSSSTLRREVNQLFGNIIGIEMDNLINQDEMDYLKKWKDEHEHYSNNNEVSGIINVINKIIEDGIITNSELGMLKCCITDYLELQVGSIETIASQKLQGIIEGLVCDCEINEKEIEGLSDWLYSNDYLRGHYPYDTLLETIRSVIEDGIITSEEKELFKNRMIEVNKPLDSIKEKLVKFDGKSFCLSGDFSYGRKTDVEKYIILKGGLIHSCVKKTTDYVVVGNGGSEAYSNGTYGTKVKKAYEKGIPVLKENMIFHEQED